MRANEGQHHAVATARATVLRRLNLRTWENCPWTFTPFNFNEVGLSCQPSEVELKDAFYTGVQASDSFPTTLITAQVIYVTETSIPATLLMDYMRNQSRAISDSKLDSLRKSAFNTIADFFEQFIKCVDLKTSPIFVTSAIWKNCQYTRKSRLHMLCISQQAPTWDKENSCMCYKEFASTPHRLRWGSCWCPWWSQPLFWHVFVHGVSVINGGGDHSSNCWFVNRCGWRWCTGEGRYKGRWHVIMRMMRGDQLLPCMIRTFVVYHESPWRQNWRPEYFWVPSRVFPRLNTLQVRLGISMHSQRGYKMLIFFLPQCT